MRIAIDAHSIGTRLGGNESYAANLIEALARIDSVNNYTLYVTTNEAADRYSGRWPNFLLRSTRPHTPLIRIPLILSAELRKNPVDVLHVQFTSPPFCPCPVVVSVHDLSFEHLPHTFHRRSRTQLRLTVRHSVRRAARVLTLSEHTRNDVIETYGIDGPNVEVIPIAASPNLGPVSDEKELQRVRHTYRIESDYILAVGSIQPRKNLVRLVRAYSLLRNKMGADKLPKLVFVGKRAWLYDETLRAIEDAGLTQSVVLTGYVPESDLPALYSGATCFVYPSIFEGFGLPPLEAMQCGAPVVIGNRTSLPEVVGDAAVSVDPFDVHAIAGAIEELLKKPAVRDELRVKGFARAKMFDWNETARRTLRVYEQVAKVNANAGQLRAGSAR